jgi:hypothetical protein
MNDLTSNAFHWFFQGIPFHSKSNIFFKTLSLGAETVVFESYFSGVLHGRRKTVASVKFCQMA